MVLQAEAKDALIAAEAATSCSDSQEKQNTRLRNCKSLYPPGTIAFRPAAKATLHEQRGGRSRGNQRRPASLAH